MKNYLVEISFRMKKGHPDWVYVEDHRKTQYFRDIYSYDEEKWISFDAFWAWMQCDVAIVASGGYDANHIKNVKICAHPVSEKYKEKYKEELKRRTVCL